jgi:hypothetical protein
MNTQAIRVKNQYLSNVNAALAATTTDPRAANCRGFQVDSRNQVVGIELVVVRIPSAPYELYRAEMFDPYTSGGNAVVKCVAVDVNNVEVGEHIVKAWPFPDLNGEDSPAGSGNPNNEFEISSKFDGAHGVIGPLAFHLVDAKGAIISDVIGGYGQVAGYGHIGGRVTFKQRSASDPDETPDPVPDGDALTRIAVAIEALATHLGA